jgi:hypothetical protein
MLLAARLVAREAVKAVVLCTTAATDAVAALDCVAVRLRMV